ncbi:MAG: hypothetical protein P1U75_19490 [Antarcticimicrobium sp.]|uniref:hypothetical protein n=1 Tax=Antarcticimicrobium sp. TaxID=2824147 RepID=UPI0026219F48|nr:hypothetical protein [Antarcticimicrobium sp.]MDF1718824.1 hypothetical protein [Antarcticimicrobium sp.]
MSVANWIAIFVPFVGLVGGAIVYQVQKTVDRANQLRAERRDLYRKLVSTFNDFNVSVLLNKTSEALEAFIAYKGLEAETIVCAPDHVVQALENLSGLMASYASERRKNEANKADMSEEVKKTSEEVRKAYDSAVEAMRVDVLGKTMISASMIADFTRGFVASIGRFPL